MDESESKPLWISHRGLRGQWTENTIAAFRAAVDGGYEALETDLRITADGHIVLLHDADLARLTGETGDVALMTRASLERVRFPCGSPVAFFDQFVETFPGCQWTLDIKPESGAAVIRSLVEWTQRNGSAEWLQANTRFLCWRGVHEAALRAAFPGGQFYATERECWRAGLSVLARSPGLGGFRTQRVYSLPPRLGPLNLFPADYVQAIRSRGARALAYLPQPGAEAKAAVSAGFDEILSNFSIEE